jgi:3-hydroxyacyl-CoA dehydrogenase
MKHKDHRISVRRFIEKVQEMLLHYFSGKMKKVSRVEHEVMMRSRNISDEEILQRLLYPMVNEGAKILEEKIAIRASDIDVIWVYGYGWPIYRGGPMFWADSIGLKAVRDQMLAYKKQSGDDLWTPAPLLDRLAEAGKGFLG